MLSFFSKLFNLGMDDATPVDQNSVEMYLQEGTWQEPDELAVAATNRAHRGDFLSLLAQRGMWVLIRLDQGEYEGDIHLMEYEDGGRTVLPIFSSLYEAVAFLHTVDLTEMLPVQYLHVTTAFLTHNDLSQHKVIMNPFAGATTEIQEPDINALREAYEE